MSYTSTHVPPLWLWHWYWLPVISVYLGAKRPWNNWMKPHWTSCSANHAPGLFIFIHRPWHGLAWNWRMLAWPWNSCLVSDNQEHGVVLITPQTSQFPWLLLSSISPSLLDPGGLLHRCCVSSAFTVGRSELTLFGLHKPGSSVTSASHCFFTLWNVLAPARTPPPPAPKDLGSLLCTASSRKGSPCVPSG